MPEFSKKKTKIKLVATAAILAAAVATLLLWVPKPLFADACSTVVYSADGRLLGARIAPDGQWRFPQCDSVPQRFAQCVVAFEDKRFRLHPGIDAVALCRAVLENIRAGSVVSGGSTITMQLCRMARGNKSRNILQKSIEALWAMVVEVRYSKDEILNLYASHAPFGGNVVGLSAAAWRYFGCSADKLSWAECATLAVLPNAPSLIHPGRNRDALKRKRDALLERLCTDGIIDSTDMALAKAEPLPQKPFPLPDDAPHLLNRYIAENLGGTGVTSTIDSRLQQRVQAIVDGYARRYESNHICNAAALVADIETGRVMAYVGNVGHAVPEPNGNMVDMVAAERSTGSLLKPFLYAAMLHDGDIMPNQLVADIPLNIMGFSPQNYNRTYYGAVPARMAIERSLNVPLVRMLSHYNTGRFMSKLKQLGMTTLHFSEQHYGAAIVLGGAEGTLWNICGMYASMARVLGHFGRFGGRYMASDVRPLTAVPQPLEQPVRSVVDPRLTDKPVLCASAIWHTFEAMSELSRPEEESDWQQFMSMKRVAWKTGTSSGGRDAWAVGLTPKYVVGVWVGNASGEGRAGLTGVGWAAPVMFDIFSLLPSGGGWFDMPLDDCVAVGVCRQSGHRASAVCDKVDTVYVPPSSRLTAECPYHRRVHFSADGRFRVNAECESVHNMLTVPWFVLPPSQEHFYMRWRADYRPLPPLRADCAELQQGQMSVIYPADGSALFLPRGVGGERESFVFRAAHARADATIFWHLDDDYLGSTRGDHRLSCSPPAGRHRLVLVDDAGVQVVVRVEVKR